MYKYINQLGKLPFLALLYPISVCDYSKQYVIFFLFFAFSGNISFR